MKIKLLILLSCLVLVSALFADQPSSDNYILIQRGFLTGNANQASPPGSTSYELTESSMLGIADDAETSAGYLNYPGFLQPNNHAPTIALPPVFTFPEDDGLIVDFAPFINDINGDIVTLSVSGNIEVMVDIVDFTVTFSATADWNGTESLTFTANDNMDRAVASDIVDITVTEVNDDPTIVLPDDFAFDEDDELIVDFSTFVEDVDLDDLFLTVTGNTEITVDIDELEVTFGATENWNGTETLTFTVDDGQGERASFTTSRSSQKQKQSVIENSRATADDVVDVIVLPVNDDPTIVLPDDFTFDEDDGLMVDFTEFINDVDLDDLTLTVTGNTEITVDINGFEVTFGATADWNGTETLTFIVDDNVTRATAEDDVDVIVTPVNDEPVLIGFLPEELEFTVVEDSMVTFSVDVEDIDSTIEYAWFVDDVLQTESSEEFVHIFEVVGDIEIKSIASDEDYNIETIWIVQVEEGSDAGDILPVTTDLNQNYPNPFNPTTTINYSIIDAGRVRIEIFNIKGEKIRTLVDESKNVGYHSAVWNGRDNNGKSVASGMYFYNMVTDEYHKTRKMLLIK
ncbi:MAG: Ig-like domain-containing protein [Candidatus Cloacimonetes bacterium]|nr:Ig-like domain-containing protein [Candidatus Cloacimonadota bacterium]